MATKDLPLLLISSVETWLDTRLSPPLCNADESEYSALGEAENTHDSLVQLIERSQMD